MTYACETPPSGPAAKRAAHLQAQIPRLETERLILRAPRIEDFETYADIAQSHRGAFLNAATREDVWYDFAGMVANWVLRGHGVWTILEKPSDAPAGFVLLGFEPGDEAPELGFILTADAEGRGIAFEAANAAKTHARDALNLTTLFSYVDTGNTRSVALAKRLDAQPDGYVDAQTHRFRHPMGAA